MMMMMMIMMIIIEINLGQVWLHSQIHSLPPCLTMPVLLLRSACDVLFSRKEILCLLHTVSKEQRMTKYINRIRNFIFGHECQITYLKAFAYDRKLP